jgi:two-component system, OmpR family, sensor histidine kinase AdeS
MKKARKPWSLKTLFALASTACVFVTVIIGYFGLTAYAEIQTREIRTNMSPAAIRAQNSIDARQVPSIDDTQALMAFAETIDANFEAQQQIALLILSVFAATLGAGLSLFLADRLARPIAEVAGAARKIAKGDLSARADCADTGIGESAQLITDFNQMAAALERFEREMNESSAAIAHELRTPLTVLRGYVQGAIDGVFPPTNTHLTLLLVHIESLSRVVDDLQTLSLANNGALSMTREAMDASLEVGTLLDALEPSLASSGLTLRRTLHEAPMSGDPVRVRQAVSALIDNAKNYAAVGKIIEIETGSTLTGVFVRVLDYGPGMTCEQIARGFERFWRAEPSRGKASGGSGLGLSVVKAIALAHSGQAHLRNREGGGLCAELLFPKGR